MNNHPTRTGVPRITNPSIAIQGIGKAFPDHDPYPEAPSLTKAQFTFSIENNCETLKDSQLLLMCKTTVDDTVLLDHPVHGPVFTKTTDGSAVMIVQVSLSNIEKSHFCVKDPFKSDLYRIPKSFNLVLYSHQWQPYSFQFKEGTKYK